MAAKTTRRRFIENSLALGASIAAPGLSARRLFAASATAPIHDYTSREAFDHYDRAWNDGDGNSHKNNEHGALGWGEGWLLAAYVVMYRAHRDTRYLDKLIAHFDRVLKSRDSVRGVTDWRGRSLPSWRSTGDYTCGSLTLNDAQGRPSLHLRTAARPADRLSVVVAPGQRPETFKLIATKMPTPKGEATAGAPIVDTYDNLTMDPTSADFAVMRINSEFVTINAASPRTMLTARDARPAPKAAGAPAVADQPQEFAAMPFIYAVQVGQLTYPVATFIRLVRENPKLAPYQAKADEYLDAIEQAVSVHDDEWREDAASKGGYLMWPKGSPNAFDGCDQPHNQYLSLGRVMIHLAVISRNADRRQMYRDRATKMARLFKHDLQLSKDAYMWTYFWTKGRGFNGWQEGDDVSQNQPTMVWPRSGGYREIEDTSHAVLDIDFAKLAFKNDLGVFDEADMKRFANTFTDNLYGIKDVRPTFYERVDGTGRQGALDNAAAGWLPLAAWQGGIFDAIRVNYARRQPAPGPSTIPLGIAYLNLFAQR